MFRLICVPQQSSSAITRVNWYGKITWILFQARLISSGSHWSFLSTWYKTAHPTGCLHVPFFLSRQVFWMKILIVLAKLCVLCLLFNILTSKYFSDCLSFVVTWKLYRVECIIINNKTIINLIIIIFIILIIRDT